MHTIPMNSDRSILVRRACWLGCLLAIAAISADARAEELADDRDERIAIAGLDWHTDYGAAYEEAQREQKMLLINFVPVDESDAQTGLEEWIADNESVRERLGELLLARLPSDVEIEVDGEPRRLLRHNAFRHMGGRPGIAMVDLEHTDLPHYGDVVTVLPFGRGKYYRWRNDHLRVALDLPAGTVTQRMMVWAVRTHPEKPASTNGEGAPALLTAAAEHSSHQARIGVQGHHRWDTRFHQIRARVGAGSASEVVAESWPNQDLIDSCIDCVQSWRQSPGHWRSVRGRHRMFGYDIRRGRNGIWYGTGIFAN